MSIPELIHHFEEVIKIEEKRIEEEMKMIELSYTWINEMKDIIEKIKEEKEDKDKV
jgi:hypothetical protein